MLDLGDVPELVDDGFRNGTFSEERITRRGDHLRFHVVPKLGHQVDAPKKKSKVLRSRK
jgi:hypothetical protein